MSGKKFKLLRKAARLLTEGRPPVPEQGFVMRQKTVQGKDGKSYLVRRAIVLNNPESTKGTYKQLKKGRIPNVD